MGVRAEEILGQLDAAFEGDSTHSLAANVASVRAEDWDWLPPNGARSIRAIVQHAGGAKLMYVDSAFGDGSLAMDDPLVQGEGALDSPEGGATWLREAHERLRSALAGLDDAELDGERPAPWGGTRPLVDLLYVLVRHDLYHAGEINHLRALAQDNDAWAW